MTLKRTGIKRGTKRLNPASAKRRAERADPNRDIVRALVLERDRHQCVLRTAQWAGPCYGRLSMHHRKKEGQGGAWSVENLVTMCIGHNDRIESDADLAARCREAGLVLSAYS